MSSAAASDVKIAEKLHHDRKRHHEVEPMDPCLGAHPDLQAARTIFANLLLCLVRTFNTLPPWPTSEKVNLASGKEGLLGRKLLRDEINELDATITKASSLQGICKELDEACDDSPTVTREMIEFARSVSEYALTLTRTNDPDCEAVRNWRLRHTEQLRCFIDGIVFNPASDYKPSTGLDSEFRKVARRRDQKNPRQTRVVCNSSNLSISLDGKLLVSGLEQDVFDYFAAVVEAYPKAIGFREIKLTSATLLGANQTGVTCRPRL